MTASEQPDTAADSGRDYAHVLAWFRETRGVAIAPTDIVLALRDLDAARAELNDFKTEFTVLDEAHSEEMARAEAAEARIAAALGALNSADDMEYRIRIARRALNGHADA